MRLGHNTAAAHTCGWITTQSLRIHARLDHTDHGAYMRLGHNTVAAHTCGWTTLGATVRLGYMTGCTREASEVGWSVSSVDRSSPLAARCRSIGRRLSPGCVTTADARGAIIIRERQYSALKACLIPSCYVMTFTMTSWHLPPQARAAPQSVPPRTRSERAAPRRTPAARGARARERRARSNGPIALF